MITFYLKKARDVHVFRLQNINIMYYVYMYVKNDFFIYILFISAVIKLQINI